MIHIFLDTAYLINAIPNRYKDLGLDEIDTYFAMARGYQDEKNNVKALEMTKWFNTNYHYIIPEIDQTTELKINNIIKNIINVYVDIISKLNDLKVKLVQFDEP